MTDFMWWIFYKDKAIQKFDEWFERVISKTLFQGMI